MPWLDMTFSESLDLELYLTLAESPIDIALREANNLLKQGANINAVGMNDEIQKPASMLAGLLHEPFDSNEHRSKRIVEFFLSHGFNPKANDGKTGAQVLAYLICFTHPEEELLETISLLLDAGADPACAYETIDVTEDEYYSDTCNGICHGDPKNALNCAYLNMAFSEHDYFDLWSPCAFWTVHRLFDKAARKKNYRDIHYCSACVGEHIRKVYAVSKEHTSLSLCAKKSINFAYPDPGNPPKPNDSPCFIVVCDSTTLIVNVYLFCYCDDSFSDFTGAVPVELPADIAGQKITDLRGRRSGFKADSNDNLTIVLENGKALGITDAATVERLQLTAVPVISKVRKGKPLPSSVFRSGFLKSKWWKDS